MVESASLGNQNEVTVHDFGLHLQLEAGGLGLQALFVHCHRRELVFVCKLAAKTESRCIAILDQSMCCAEPCHRQRGHRTMTIIRLDEGRIVAPRKRLPPPPPPCNTDNAALQRDRCCGCASIAPPGESATCMSSLGAARPSEAFALAQTTCGLLEPEARIQSHRKRRLAQVVYETRN